MNEFEEIKNVNSKELNELNSKIQDLMSSKQCIETEIEKLKQYMESGEGKFKFVRYIDVSAFRESEIENKSEAENTIGDMEIIVQNINRVLSEKENRANELWQENYRISALKNKRKNRVRKEIKKDFDESTLGINEEKQDNDASNIQNVSNELSNAQGIILRQRNKIKTLEQGISENDLRKMIDENKCRKKNGKINYSALGKILGCTHHTAKSKCGHFNIS